MGCIPQSPNILLTYVTWLETDEECKSKSKDEEYVDRHCLKIVVKLCYQLQDYYTIYFKQQLFISKM